MALPSQVEAVRGQVRVTVVASADELYAQTRQTPEGLREETYVFTEGKFLPGESTESSLLTISFSRLVEPLAHGLARQNYFPTRDQEAADLLISVHWGATAPADFEDVFQENVVDRTQDALENQNPDPALIDYGLMNQLSALQDSISSGIDQEVMDNAKVLGYVPALLQEQERRQKRWKGEGQSDVSKQLSEPRFFIVLMAWDNQLLRSTGERKLLWVSRANVPEMGNRFFEVVPALIRVASESYGLGRGEMFTQVTDLGPGNVRMSEPEVIGIEE